MGKSSTKLAGPGRMGSAKAVKQSLKGGGGNPNVKIVPKENSITVRFLDEPEDFFGLYEHWLSDGPVACTEDCEHCASDDPEERKRQFRYLANAYVVDDQKVVVLKLPKTLVELLMNFYKKYDGTLLDRDYDLSRTGSGQNDTRYFAAPDAPRSIKLSRFDDKKFDLEEIAMSLANPEAADDDDDEDEPKKKKGKKKEDPWEDLQEPPKKKKSKSASSKKTVVKNKPTSKPTVKRTVKRKK